MVIEDFGGAMTMEPGGRFIFTDGRMRGLNFNGGEGARLHGLTATFQQLPTVRIPDPAQECIVFHDTADTLVENVEIDGSASGGLVFSRCLRPSVDGARITNTMADGLHFANCKDARARNVVTENTGDDGLAFLNYADGPDHTGGYATNITVRNSIGRGIAVDGQRNVTVDGFLVDTTACPGIRCAYDSYWNTRIPSNVVFKNGEIRNAGRITEHYPDVQKCGIYYHGVESVEFRDITVTSPQQRGVTGEQRGRMGAAPSGIVVLSGIEVRDAPEQGFALVGGNSASSLVGGRHELDDLVSDGSGQVGIYLGYNESVGYGKLTVINASGEDTKGRAFSFGHNAAIEGDEMHVVDEQSPMKGYIVNAHGAQTGGLGTIHARVSAGDVAVELQPGSENLAHLIEGAEPPAEASSNPSAPSPQQPPPG